MSDWSGLPPLDEEERAELERLRDRYARQPAHWYLASLVEPAVPGSCCPDCGHQHAGVELGQICIGCPCRSVPATGYAR